MQSRRDHLVKFLVKELNGVENVKRFSTLLKELNLCDLTDDDDFNSVTANGGVLLQTLVSWFSLGFLDKLIEIKKLIKGE